MPPVEPLYSQRAIIRNHTRGRIKRKHHSSGSHSIQPNGIMCFLFVFAKRRSGFHVPEWMQQPAKVTCEGLGHLRNRHLPSLLHSLMIELEWSSGWTAFISKSERAASADGGGEKRWINAVKVFKARGEMRGIRWFTNGAEDEQQPPVQKHKGSGCSLLLPSPSPAPPPPFQPLHR